MATTHDLTSTIAHYERGMGDPRFTATDRLLAKRTRAERARDEMPDEVYENLLALALES